MVGLWYAIVASTLVAWAVLDGLDFGAGIVQPLVARDEAERGTVLAAIGPVWDGNEVWLVAAGGVFVFAFPQAYSVALSGMYLPLILALWLIILRGLAIELRAQLQHPLWRRGSDSLFVAASLGMAFVGGVAVGNVVRGFPIGDGGTFQLDLFVLSGARVGAIDAYTGSVGVLAVVTLAAHGASYLAWKTEGEVRRRAVLVARRAWMVVLPATFALTVATGFVRPSLFTVLPGRPWAWPWPATMLVSPVLALRALASGRELRAFLASGAFVASLLLATASTLYPVLLASTLGADHDVDAPQASTSSSGSMAWGLAWWLPAAALGVLYFVNLYRAARGRVKPGSSAHG